MTDKEFELVKKIKSITNGSFLPEHYTSTLLGYCSHKDEYGRELNPDCNRKHGKLIVDDVEYEIMNTTKYVWIWNKEKNVDISLVLMPDYLKEYSDKKKFTDGIITEFVSVKRIDSVITEDFHQASIKLAETMGRELKGWTVRYNNRYEVIDIALEFDIESDYTYNHRNDPPQSAPAFVYAPYIMSDTVNVVGNADVEKLNTKVKTKYAVENISHIHFNSFKVDALC